MGSLHGASRMPDDWRADKVFSDQFLPEIKQILGLHLIAESPIEEDQKRNTDLIVLRLDAIRIGCRVRRTKGKPFTDARDGYERQRDYLKEYGDEFTIRLSRPSGNETELAKIISGWGDYFFYGFGDEESGTLARWGLGDLRVFRRWFAGYMARNGGKWPGVTKRNRDGSSELRAFKWRDPPSSFVVASSSDLCDAA